MNRETVYTPADMRAAAALVAASVGVMICLHQQHFVLTPHGDSVRQMLRHRCGMVMTAALLWAGCESLLTLARQARPARQA